jgi:ABC-type Fe3+/spermidine/putrescine transport system ATPase subunit
MMADDLVLMDAGRIIQAGAPHDLYTRPTSVAAARLLGPLNLVEGQVRENLATSILGQKSVAAPNGPAWMGLRPTDIKLAGSANGLEARVVSVSFAGGYHHVRVEAGSQALSLHVTGEVPAAGAMVSLAIDPDRLMVLPV